MCTQLLHTTDLNTALGELLAGDFCKSVCVCGGGGGGGGGREGREGRVGRVGRERGREGGRKGGWKYVLC